MTRRPSVKPPSGEADDAARANEQLTELRQLVDRLRSAAEAQQTTLARLTRRRRRGDSAPEELEKTVRQVATQLVLFEGLSSSLAQAFSDFELPLRALTTTPGTGSIERERLASLSRSARELNACRDPDTLLSNALGALVDLSGAERALLMLRDEGQPAMTLRASHNFEPDLIDAADFAVSRSIMDEVVSTPAPVLTTNASVDPRFSGLESVALHSLRSILCVPLTHSGDVIGVIYLDDRAHTDRFDEGDLDFATAFATQVAAALGNVRDFHSLTGDRDALHQIVAGFPAGILAVARDGRVTLINETALALLHLEHDDTTGRSYRRLARILDGALTMLLDEVLHYRQAVIEPVAGRLPDGRDADLEARISPLADGGVVMLLVERSPTSTTGV